MNIEDLLSKQNTFAIVGASNDRSKYGNKVYRDLRDAGYKVIPINHREDTIEGDKAYHKLSDYDEKIDVVNLVVPPKVSLTILQEALDLGIKKIWFQPGSSNEDCIEFAKKHKLSFIANQCIMVQRKLA